MKILLDNELVTSDLSYSYHIDRNNAFIIAARYSSLALKCLLEWDKLKEAILLGSDSETGYDILKTACICTYIHGQFRCLLLVC